MNGPQKQKGDRAVDKLFIHHGQVDPTPMMHPMLKQKMLDQFHNTAARISGQHMAWRRLVRTIARIPEGAFCAACCALAAIIGFAVGGIPVWQEYDQAVEREFAAYISVLDVGLDMEEHATQEAL